jgi:hypothetical protein
MYMIMGVIAPWRHLLLATPPSAIAAIDCYMAAKRDYAEVLINDPRGRPIDIDVLHSHAALEIDAELSGGEAPTLH